MHGTFLKIEKNSYQNIHGGVDGGGKGGSCKYRSNSDDEKAHRGSSTHGPPGFKILII
jgi:hypothetical protein